MKVARFADLAYIPASHENKDNPGALKKVLFTRADFVPGLLQMVNWAMVPKGRSFQRHFHEDMDEVFVIVSGTCRMEINDESCELAPGDAVIVKAGEKHLMENCCESDVTYIVFGVAAGKGGKTIVAP